MPQPSGWRRQGLYWEAGPEVSKRQVMHLDLRDVGGDEVVVRLEAPPGVQQPSVELRMTRIKLPAAAVERR